MPEEILIKVCLRCETGKVSPPMKLETFADNVFGRPHGTPGATADEEKLPGGYEFRGD